MSISDSQTFKRSIPHTLFELHMPPKGQKKGADAAAEAFSKLALNAGSQVDEEEVDSQSMDSDDEEYQEHQAPKSILRRVCGMKKIYVRTLYYFYLLMNF